MTGKPNGEANSQSCQLDEEELQKLEEESMPGGNVNVSLSSSSERNSLSSGNFMPV